MADYFALIGFGPVGWGGQLVRAAAMTLAVALAAFATGLGLGAIGAAAKLSSWRAVRAAANLYTTLLRGVPDLLVIYLVFFGGSQALMAIAHALGGQGFFGLNGFLAGAIAVGIVSGAYQTEVIWGAVLAVPRGELEAARALGLPTRVMVRHVLAPRMLRFALPGMGNIWQGTLEESSLISVTGLYRDTAGDHRRRCCNPTPVRFLRDRCGAVSAAHHDLWCRIPTGRTLGWARRAGRLRWTWCSLRKPWNDCLLVFR